MGAKGLFQTCAVVASLACASAAGAADVTTATTGTDAAATDTAAAPLNFGPGGTSTTRTNFFTYGADVGVGYSDNLSETSTDKKSDEIVGVGVQLAGYEQSARFVGAMLGDLEHLNYLQGTYSPEVIGNFGGYASYALVPEFLHWMAQDSFGQGVVDPFASQAPANLENVNTITTGPTLTLPLNALTLLDLSARYSRVSYQVSPLDSNDYGGALSLTHLFSARSRLSFNLQTQRYDYTNPINPSYDQREAFVRYDVQGARTRITLDVGYDQIRGYQLNSNGPLARFAATRTIAEGSVISLSAGHDPSSTSEFLTQSQGVSGIGLQATPGRQAATPFTNEYETVGWSFNRRRTTLSITLSHYQQIFDGQSILDQSISTAEARVSRLVAPGWMVAVFGDYSKQAFAQQPGNFTEEHGGVSVKWQLARKLAMSLQYDHFNRDSPVALYAFSENRLFLRLQYGSEAAVAGGGETSLLNTVSVDPFNIPMPTH
jgi:hypothetical protein